MKGITIACLFCTLFVTQTQWVQVKSAGLTCSKECVEKLVLQAVMEVKAQAIRLEESVIGISEELEERVVKITEKVRTYVTHVLKDEIQDARTLLDELESDICQIKFASFKIITEGGVNAKRSLYLLVHGEGLLQKCGFAAKMGGLVRL